MMNLRRNFLQLGRELKGKFLSYFWILVSEPKKITRYIAAVFDFVWKWISIFGWIKKRDILNNER